MPTNETYTFDSNGNRKSTAGASQSANGTFNRLQTDGTYNYQYDNEGNTIKRTLISSGAVTEYVWDHRNRLTTVTERVSATGATTKKTEYVYDAFDQRIGKKFDADGNGTWDRYEEFIWSDGQEQLRLVDTDGQGTAQPFRIANRYMWGESVDQLFADEQYTANTGYALNAAGPSTVQGNTLWALADQLGSIRDVVDNNGIVRQHLVFDSFGRRVREVDHNTSGTQIANTDINAIDELFGYTGRDWDTDTGLQNNRARWYDPANGRFLSQDPIGFAAADANLYRYVGNQVTNAIDPRGLVIIWVDGIDTDKNNTHAASVAKGLKMYAAQNSLTEQGFLYFDFPMAGTWDGMSSPSSYDKNVAKNLKKLIDAIQKANNCGESVFLVGFSNGTDIVKLALDYGAKVDGVVFLGSAVDADTDLRDAMKNTHWLHNYWSDSDYVAGSFADGMGSREMRETKNRKNKSLSGVTNEKVYGFVHTESGGDKSGDEKLTKKDSKTRVPWTSFFVGFSLLGKLLKPSEHRCISDGGALTAPNGAVVTVKPGYQTVPSGVKK